MPTISRKELIRKFRALGFEGPFSGGKHQFMIKGKKKVRIPNHETIDSDYGLELRPDVEQELLESVRNAREGKLIFVEDVSK